MSCKCHEKNAVEQPTYHEPTFPHTPCLYCAEKHISTAAALAKEFGYSAPNRGYVVGELVAAAWHLSGLPDARAEALAERVREFRHRVQSREEDEAAADFSPLLAEIDFLILEDMKHGKNGGDA